jgi:3-oxoacyl-[acyl-carrier-protein] synthase II
MMNNKRVAVTGLGLMTGLGLDIESTWQGLIAGRSPIKLFSLFNPKDLSSPFGIEIPGGVEELFKKHIITRNRKQMTRGTMLALVLAHMALTDSGLDLEKTDRERVGVVIGATGTGYAPLNSDMDRHRILKNMANAAAAWISIKWKLKGPSFIVSTACSSGIYALGSAIQLILQGQCDIVITGAVESTINFLDIQGFSSMMALSEKKDDIKTASRPFDKERDGFVIGEGGGMLILESLSSVKKRGTPIYAETYPPGLSSEAYNIMSPERDGRGMLRAMDLALKNADLKPQDINYINAHGTSTLLNDLYETKAIKELFKERAYSIPVSSTKSMTGHCLSGAAGVESVICCKVIKEGIIPPTINLTVPDPELDLDYVPNQCRKAILKHVMCNSFAFGGHNGVAIFSKRGS